MSRSLRVWIALDALMLLLAACAGSTATPQAAPSSAPMFPMTVQNCGQQVTLPKEPKRIVTIGYEAVNLINAAGGASRIVATFDNIKDPADPAFTAVPHPELVSDKAKFLALPGVKDMQAVRNNQFISLPYSQTQATVSAVTGLETIAKGIQTVSR